MHSFDAWFDAHQPRYGQTHRNVAFFAWTAARKSQGGLVIDICRAYEQGKAGTYAAYPLKSLEHIAYGHGVSVATDAHLTLCSKQATASEGETINGVDGGTSTPCTATTGRAKQVQTADTPPSITRNTSKQAAGDTNGNNHS